VVQLGANLGSRALYRSGRIPSEPFVYTDPDVVPVEDCPLDAVAHLAELLDRFPHTPKVGLGLYLADVPESMDSLGWERRLLQPEPGDAWLGEIAPGVFDSLIDTTFALYRPGVTGHDYRGIRTGWPYQARHMSWYSQGELSAEDAYYLQRAIPGPEGSSWAQARRGC
jgi:hypothetical protein